MEKKLRLLRFIYNWSWAIVWIFGCLGLAGLLIVFGAFLPVFNSLQNLKEVSNVLIYSGRAISYLAVLGPVYVILCIVVAITYYKEHVYRQWLGMAWRTEYLRKYMKQSISKIASLNIQLVPDVQRNIVVSKAFNRNLKYTFVDYHTDKIAIFIRIPASDECVKILNDMKPRLLDYIKRQSSDFRFSNFEARNNYLVVEGTKIKSKNS